MGSSGSYRNPHTLVEVTSFAAVNKFQPFNVAISSNALFLLVCPTPTLSVVGQGLPHLGRGLGCSGGGASLECQLRVGGDLVSS